MGLLAEPRRKQRIGVDPRNLAWKNDESKFGHKMMEKEGKGLGRNEQGNAANLKLAPNYTQKGLGALASYDSTWIAHHDDFSDLLAQLNAKKGRKEEDKEGEDEQVHRESIEMRSKCTKARIHYQKFTRMKDLSRYTDEDKTAVLGLKKSNSKKEVPERVQEQDMAEAKKDESEKPHSEGTVNTVSTLSVAEYFAAKMAALKNRNVVEKMEARIIESTTTEELVPSEESSAKEDEKKERKRKKREEKRRLKEEEEQRLREEEERQQRKELKRKRRDEEGSKKKKKKLMSEDE